MFQRKIKEIIVHKLAKRICYIILLMTTVTIACSTAEVVDESNNTTVSEISTLPKSDREIFYDALLENNKQKLLNLCSLGKNSHACEYFFYWCNKKSGEHCLGMAQIYQMSTVFVEEEKTKMYYHYLDLACKYKNQEGCAFKQQPESTFINKMQGKAWVGMTKAQAVEAFGNPTNVYTDHTWCTTNDAGTCIKKFTAIVFKWDASHRQCNDYGSKYGGWCSLTFGSMDTVVSQYDFNPRYLDLNSSWR